MGGYVKTSGVNTNPANDDQKFYLDFYFYDKQATHIYHLSKPPHHYPNPTPLTSTTCYHYTQFSKSAIPRFLLENNDDGVIFAGKINQKYVKYVEELGLPYILVDYDLSGKKVSAVMIDNVGKPFRKSPSANKIKLRLTTFQNN